MTITKEQFLALKEAQKEHIIAALYAARYTGFSVERGVDITVPAGYSVRVAVLLVAEEPDEVVEKRFILLEEFNDFITAHDMDKLIDYADQLAQTGKFKPERDTLTIVTNEKWTYTAYELVKGKIELIDVESLLKKIPKYYEKDRELRNVILHYTSVEG